MEENIVFPTPSPPRALLPLVGWATWGDSVGLYYLLVIYHSLGNHPYLAVTSYNHEVRFFWSTGWAKRAGERDEAGAAGSPAGGLSFANEDSGYNYPDSSSKCCLLRSLLVPPCLAELPRDPEAVESGQCWFRPPSFHVHVCHTCSWREWGH